MKISGIGFKAKKILVADMQHGEDYSGDHVRGAYVDDETGVYKLQYSYAKMSPSSLKLTATITDNSVTLVNRSSYGIWLSNKTYYWTAIG